MVKAKVFILKNRFTEFPKREDIRLIEEDLPPVKDGEFLAEAVFLSIDPYVREFIESYPLGSPVFGRQVSLVKESKNPDFPVGKYVVGSFGWRTHTVTNGKSEQEPKLPTIVLPDFGGLPLSLALGVLGTPGNTAHFGFLEVCKPKEGETVVVSGAAGAVGSVVGQIAKIKKCKVIGIAGSDVKLKWLQEDLGFDGGINYKTQNVRDTLKKLAPQGVDCYFDNIGGEMTETVLSQMNHLGRVSICGCISAYKDEKSKGTALEFPILWHQLKVEGFDVRRYTDRWLEGISLNLEWIKDGKMKYQETVTKGFENAFEAFINVLKGNNTGKAIVQI